MKTSQSFPFYPTDFLIGTMLMTPAQVGGYIRALCYQWETGGLPVGFPEQQRITQCTEQDMAVIAQKFRLKNGVLVNEKMERVRAERGLYIEKQRLNGAKGGRPVGRQVANPSLSSGLTQTITQKKPSSTSTNRAAQSADNARARTYGDAPKGAGAAPKGADAIPPVPALASAEYRQALGDWWGYKRERGQTYKARGWAGLLSMLGKWPEAIAIQAIRTSIASNWAGLFPHREEAGGGTRTKPEPEVTSRPWDRGVDGINPSKSA